jgi:hypothetical protein
VKMLKGRRLLGAVIVAGTVVAGCTGASGDADRVAATSPAAKSPSPAAARALYTLAVDGLAAEYRHLGERRGVLTIRSGSPLAGEPSLYVLGALDGERIDAGIEVDASDPSRFRVSFPIPVRQDEMGLVLLSIGDDNLGAFIPPTA